MTKRKITKITARARAHARKVFQKALYTFSDGLSILLSMVLITVIVLFSIGVTTLVVDSARQSANVKDGTTAYYAAEAGLEQALWINKELVNTELSIGAEESGESDVGTNSDVKFKIQGSSEFLLEETVNGKHIIPFPWTGDVPWHGDGSVASVGGCDPVKPPIRTGTGVNKIFAYPNVSSQYSKEIEHPCNWGRLGVGEKVTIPLYGFDTNELPKSINDFKIRVRTPCKDGKEFCVPSERLLLNCWDKGTGEERCVSSPPIAAMDNPKRGEVLMLWQIDAIKSGGSVATLTPFNDPFGSIYKDADAQFYEGKINTQLSGIDLPFELLNTESSAFPTPYPKGREIGTESTPYVKVFVDLYTKPKLTLSVVSSLVGCKDQNDCSDAYDNPEKVLTYDGPHMIPYLEYQIVIEDDVTGNPPASKDNIISAEGQSGPFNQTIQVKVPHDNSSLEYVIQQ